MTPEEKLIKIAAILKHEKTRCMRLFRLAFDERISTEERDQKLNRTTIKAIEGIRVVMGLV